MHDPYQTPVAWEYVGTCSVFNNAPKLYNMSGYFETLRRGDAPLVGSSDPYGSPKMLAIDDEGDFSLNWTIPLTDI